MRACHTSALEFVRRGGLVDPCSDFQGHIMDVND